MDDNLLGKLMDKKKDQGSLDPMYKDSKMSMLQALLQEMHGMMGGDLQGLKKVSVAAPDQKGLETGLDKAKELLAGDASAGDESKDDDGDSDFEDGIADHDDSVEDTLGEGADHDDSHGVDLSQMDPDKLEALLAELKMKLGK